MQMSHVPVLISWVLRLVLLFVLLKAYRTSSCRGYLLLVLGLVFWPLVASLGKLGLDHGIQQALQGDMAWKRAFAVLTNRSVFTDSGTLAMDVYQLWIGKLELIQVVILLIGSLFLLTDAENRITRTTGATRHTSPNE